MEFTKRRKQISHFLFPSNEKKKNKKTMHFSHCPANRNYNLFWKWCARYTSLSLVWVELNGILKNKKEKNFNFSLLSIIVLIIIRECMSTNRIIAFVYWKIILWDFRFIFQKSPFSLTNTIYVNWTQSRVWIGTSIYQTQTRMLLKICFLGNEWRRRRTYQLCAVN